MITLWFALVSLFVAPVAPVWTAQAQQTGAICVTTFADQNANGAHEVGEQTLAGVNVNLSTGGAIIATHVTTGDDAPYCFENLLPGYYSIVFTDSPTHRATTSNQAAYELTAGARLELNEFGAFPIALETLRDTLAAQASNTQTTDEPLDTSTRLLLATGGSMLVMLFMVGMGAIVLGLMSQRKRRQQSRAGLPPPIQPD